MTLQDQVIPLPMAQRLKELGVKQESYFSWFGDLAPRLMDNGKDPATIGPWLFLSTTKPCNQKTPLAAAFTVAELGQLLTDPSGGYGFTVAYNHPTWNFKGQGWAGEVISSHLNEAEARGAFLIHLLESNLITVQEVNSRI